MSRFGPPRAEILSVCSELLHRLPSMNSGEITGWVKPQRNTARTCVNCLSVYCRREPIHLARFNVELSLS